MGNDQPRTVGIHPTPRVLRVLGDIPFAPWQCIAELVDNSIDALSAMRAAGPYPESGNAPEVVISWSTSAVPANERTLEVSDSGPGMSLEQISNVARAGYSGRTPLDSLGLFGMGFNIATARIGNRTRVLSATESSEEWVGIEIDFDALQKSGDFLAPVISEPKVRREEHGTRVIVSELKPGAYAELRDREPQIRRQLERIYSPLLASHGVAIVLQGKLLTPRPACVWSNERFVMRGGERVPAVLELNEPLGTAYFDLNKNAYVPPIEADEYDELTAAGSELPPHIVMREKVLTGWVGIQRYSDPDDFGIDFVRNGRKILIADKSLFFYENPITGTRSQEYPKELGSTVGGRIIGEIEVNYLIPTYQKNDFDRQDDSWRETVEALRGIGPILPRARKAMDFPNDNASPIGRLVNAYRRADKGTKNLAIEGSLARQWAERFREGDPELIPDTKWFEAAQEADRQRADKADTQRGAVDGGIGPSDEVDAYGPDQSDDSGATESEAAGGIEETPDADSAKTSTMDELVSNSRKSVSLSKRYYVAGNPAAFDVTAWEVESGSILNAGESRACAFFSQGYACNFFYDPRHAALASYPSGPREYLALYLAERFKIRDSLVDLGAVFADVYGRNFSDARVDKIGLQERAQLFFNSVRDRMVSTLADVEARAVQIVKEHAGDEEFTVLALLEQPDLLKKFQEESAGCIECLYYVPPRALVRLVERLPGRTLDGACLGTPYETIVLGSPSATDRARSESLDRITGLMKDAIWVLGEAASPRRPGRQKEELSRCAHSISFLEAELTE